MEEQDRVNTPGTSQKRVATDLATHADAITAEFSFIEALAAELSSKQLIFPTSLNATMKIRHALNDPNGSAEKIARVAGMESVLSAQLIRVGNSATFNPGGKPTADLQIAITRLGVAMVRNVAISVGMKQLIQHEGRVGQPVIDGIWKRSIRVAALASVIARNCSKFNPNTAMLAGLLHDIGKFYILNRASVYSEIFSNDTALWNLVDRWHANIGEMILEAWEIPEEICIAVRDHRELRRTHSGPPDLTDVVIAADYLDAHFQNETTKDINLDYAPKAMTYLQLTPDRCQALLENVKHELVAIFHLLS